jgi:hypothetical protein
MTQPRMLSILRSDRACLGFVLTDCRGFKALNADGTPLGHFGTKDEAVAVIVSAAST